MIDQLLRLKSLRCKLYAEETRFLGERIDDALAADAADEYKAPPDELEDRDDDKRRERAG